MHPSDHVWYFAYGSNMQSATLRGRRGIDYRSALPARVPGWQLVLDKPPLLPVGESFANIVPTKDAEVLGVLFEMSPADYEHLESSEGVGFGSYQRVEVQAHPLQGSTGPVLAYSLSSDRRSSLLPSRRYMQLLIEGAREHGLPPDYVDFLAALPAKDESALAQHLRPVVDLFLRRR